MTRKRRLSGRPARQQTSTNFIGQTNIVGDVVAGDQTRSSARAGAEPPAQLPPDTATFRGRLNELSALHRLMKEGSRLPSGAPNVIVVTGVAGSGKSALAIHWAHQVSEHFGDGSLYLDLQGFTPGKEPLSSLTALLRLLRSLGVPEDEIPPEQPDCAARYRSELARRRVLILLDNAHGVEQLTPLLPANRDCVVLVTCRETLTELTGVAGRSVDLKTLSDEDAVALIAAAMGVTRIGNEPEAAAELAVLCGRLPLALAISSAKLASSPEQSIAEFVAELRQGDRLSALTSDHVSHLAVRTAFELSHRSLPPAERKLFSSLSLLPGRDFTLHTAAAISASTLLHARAALRRLVNAHLVERMGAGRYHLHDLIRLFAAEQICGESERDSAEANVFRWYLAAVDSAVALIDPGMVRLPYPAMDIVTELPEMSTREQAVAWLQEELENLVEAVETAEASGHHAFAYGIADALRAFFWLRRTVPEWLRVATAGLRASRQAGDRQAEAALMHSMGLVEWRRGNVNTYMDYLDQAVRLSQETGWTEGVIVAANSRATAYMSTDRVRDALDDYERAIGLSRQAGSGKLEVGLVTNQGRALIILGATDAAVHCFTTALQLSESAGSPPNVEADILGNLGYALLQAGRLAEAERQLTKALECAQQAGTPGTEASIRDLFAMTYLQLGDYERALTQSNLAGDFSLQSGSPASQADNLVIAAGISVALGRLDDALQAGRAALELYQRTHERRGKVEAFNLLGQAHHGLGRGVEARSLHRHAFRIATEIGFRYGQVEALCGLAETCMDDDSRESRLAAQQALEIAEASAFLVLAGRCRAQLAECSLAHRRYAEVADHCRAALDLHRRSGCRPGLARTLRVLGTAMFDGGRVEAAVRHWRNATRLLDRSGTPEEQRLIALLNRHSD